ncbi:transcriptional regulator SlyA [Microvirga arsenatis]|uniref:Transcriptional regulator SlyA n=1 Tax=Microvirga arsenatis TaxID=2692265 RepID=A0ABW9Z3B5_9HYPH|nr:transcriptional regulator SlyA [Microvirga arsenatis]NBJ13048.1 transcriptional regulator SlyA [Microvirga arsenatis]NBJ26833.1 transcriptional regulator SlyA [Microvirga arsenatis]
MTEDVEFAMELGKVARRWRTRLDSRLRARGLTQARWVALLALSRADGLTQRDLAATLGVEGPTLVRILDGLEAQGLIERQSCPDDRRAKRVRLTEAADPVLREIRKIADATRRELLEGIATDDLSVARRVLALIAERLEQTE